jgi:hypothetical protein
VINTRAGGEPVLVTASGGSTLFGGNNPNTNGLVFQPPAAHIHHMAGGVAFSREPISPEHIAFRQVASWAQGRPVSAAEASRFWTTEALDFIRRQPSAFVRLLGNKLRFFFHSYESHDTSSAYVRGLPLRKATAVAFTLVWALGGVGLVWSWAQRRRLLPLVGLATTYAASCLVFYVNTRLRLPTVLPICCLAGIGVSRLWSAVEHRRWTASGASLALGVLLAGVFCWPNATVKEMDKVDRSHFLYYEPAVTALSQGHIVRAVQLFGQTLDLYPGKLGLVQEALEPHAHRPRVRAFLLHSRRTVKVPPSAFDTPASAGTKRAYRQKLEQGYMRYFGRQYDDAAQVFSQAVSIQPQASQAYYFRGLCHLKLKRWAAALRDLQTSFDRGKKLEPKLNELYFEMGLAAKNLGRRGLAAEYARRALYVKPDDARARTLSRSLQQP